MTHRTLKAAVAATLATLACIALTGCGDDEKKLADCSKCPAAEQSSCKSLAQECSDKGGSEAECQSGVDAVCALSGAFADAGGD